MGGGLPPLLHSLAMEMQERQCKVEQEALFIDEWGLSRGVALGEMSAAAPAEEQGAGRFE